MAKTEVLQWNAFIKGEVVPKEVKATVLYSFAAVPVMAVANVNDRGWDQLWPQALNIADWMCLGVIVFAGGSWMFGNRTKALELLLGGAIGYEIIRHAWDILHWLQKL